MKKIMIKILFIVTIFTITGCSNEVEKTNTKNIDYSGTYKSEDSSYITLKKDNDSYKGTISIYKLTTFDDCVVDDIKNNILDINCNDPNEDVIKFTFDYKTKKLTVKETTWNLLEVDSSFDFNA